MLAKYTTIIRLAWQRSLTYRFTVLSYRIGEIIEMIVLILMWSAIYKSQEIIQNFTLQEIITYILAGNLINAAVRNFLSEVIAKDIKEGRLSVFLIRPMPYVQYILAREIGRASVATFMSVISQLLVIGFFSSTFLFQIKTSHLAILFIMLPLAFITELLISYLVGLIAFWTEEVDGLYTTIDRLKKFFAGGYFPLSLLPSAFVQISFFLPFAYSFFVPAQLYLGKIDIQTGIKGIGVQIVWILLLCGIIRIVWRAGLKKYEGVGM